MRNFLVKVLIFFLLLNVFVFTISNVKLSDEFLIYKTKGTHYQKIAWNINLLNKSPELIKDSYVFFGPSLVEVGICDSTLKSLGIPAINMGVNHSGDEIELYFVNRISKLKPRKIFLNLSKANIKGLHKMTPLLYTSGELISSGQSINEYFVRFAYKRTAFVLEYWFWKCFKDRDVTGNTSNNGVIYEPTTLDEYAYQGYTDKEMMEKFNEFDDLESSDFVLKGEENQKGFKFLLKKWRRKILYKYDHSEIFNNCTSQKNFVSQSFEIAKTNGIDITELYIPAIMDARQNKFFDKSFYAKREMYNVTSLDQFNFLDSSLYWCNLYHLSKAGAIKFSSELVNKNILTK